MHLYFHTPCSGALLLTVGDSGSQDTQAEYSPPMQGDPIRTQWRVLRPKYIMGLGGEIGVFLREATWRNPKLTYSAQ
jgi:hypothetical protein